MLTAALKKRRQSSFQALRAARVQPISKAAATIGQVEALARRLENNLAQAILRALRQQGARMNLDAIASALETGNVAKVLQLLDLPAVLAPLSGISPAVQAGVYAGGAAIAATIVPQISGVNFVFNQLNPRLIDWLQSYTFGLVRQINDATKEGVRQFLLEGMRAGENPKEVARQVQGIVGLTERQAQAVSNYRAELEGFHLRTSADAYGLGNKVSRVNGTQVSLLDETGAATDGINARRLRDFRYDGVLQRSMDNTKALSPEQVDRMVGAYEDKYLAYRARTIARTEAMRTNNIGIQEAWRQAIEGNVVSEDLVRKLWLVAADERTCDECSPIPDMNPELGVRFGQPFLTPEGPVTLPPLHPNCRCTIFIQQYEPEQIAAAEAQGDDSEE